MPFIAINLMAVLVVGFLMSGCKSVAEKSSVKDATFGSGDAAKSSDVIWLDAANKKVTKGVCPAGTSVVNRDCDGLTGQQDMSLNEYKAKLRIALIKATLGGSSAEAQKMTQSESNLKRLKYKITMTGISNEQKTEYRRQIEELDKNFSKSLRQLTPEETTEFNAILQSLEWGHDVTYKEDQKSFKNALAPFRRIPIILPPPVAGTDGNPIKDQSIDSELVVDYWLRSADKFYGETKAGYTSGAANAVSIDNEMLGDCLKACPEYYSTLVCHFYCWHPSYKQVVPNVRGCFSQIARGRFLVSKNGSQLNLYPEMYDYCTYQDFEPLSVAGGVKKLEPYDQAKINSNKSSGAKPGVMGYLTENDADIFKAVMYTWFNPFAFSDAEQQKVLTDFYGRQKFSSVTVPTASSSGKMVDSTKFEGMKKWEQEQN